jgi:hypothetical protein
MKTCAKSERNQLGQRSTFSDFRNYDKGVTFITFIEPLDGGS